MILIPSGGFYVDPQAKRNTQIRAVGAYGLTNTRECGNACHWYFRVVLAIASTDRNRWPESRVVNYFGFACIG